MLLPYSRSLLHISERTTKLLWIFSRDQRYWRKQVTTEILEPIISCISPQVQQESLSKETKKPDSLMKKAIPSATERLMRFIALFFKKICEVLFSYYCKYYCYFYCYSYFYNHLSRSFSMDR